MYESLAECNYDEITCVVLTGMGADGTNGIKALSRSRKNLYVISQDEETCVVYGMPKAIANTGLVNEVVPLNRVAEAITKTWGCLNMDVSQYLEIFIDESNEHLQSLSDQLMILEKEPENSDTINEIFRAAHSLKGMAGTMGYKRMQNLTHDMENVFSEVRNGNIKVTSDMCDVLFQCLDALESYVTNIQNTQDEGTDDNEPIIKALNSFIGGNEEESKGSTSS